MSRRRPLLDRRTFLRGAGTVAIALPFLPEMGSLTRVGSAAQAQPAPSVSRCFTVFFAHGVPLEVLRGGLTGPLAPLARLQDKLGIYGGVDLHAGSGNGHATGGMSVFVGAQRANPTTAGGP
ncbi:MAG TPA: hypothetical protein RMF84_10340, partial [Polyangiaceae bacterium LLY-WYZ-14_1]|nr:hypothetical protein [Polyangiaceae bacterium LLY-WYZ-14_1]